jgi:hypothetical protein
VAPEAVRHLQLEAATCINIWHVGPKRIMKEQNQYDYTIKPVECVRMIKKITAQLSGATHMNHQTQR